MTRHKCKASEIPMLDQKYPRLKNIDFASSCKHFFLKLSYYYVHRLPSA